MKTKKNLRRDKNRRKADALSESVFWNARDGSTHGYISQFEVI